MEDLSKNVSNSENVNSVVHEDTQEVKQQDKPTQTLQDISIDNENIALNVLVGMVNIAQKRGAYNLEESAKAWECVQMFMKNSPASA